MRMPKRVDLNHAEIARALREAGVSVADTHELGKGFPDLVCGARGQNYLLEIKRDEKAKLTGDEAKWHSLWRGQVVIVASVQEALEAVGVV